MQQNILPSQGGQVDYLGALETAIEREIKSKFIYRTMAKYTNSINLKRKLEFLAEEEQHHRENVEDLYKKISGFSRNFDELVMMPDESKVAQYKMLDVPELLKVAIDKEKESQDYYNALADYVSEDTVKELFRFLAEEEVTHRRMLELELRLYSGEMPPGLDRSGEKMPDVYREWWK